MKARRRFAQHFLEAAWVDRLVAAVAPSPDDVFLEIGPGRGALTLALASHVRRVMAVEIDRDLARLLASRAPANVEIVNEDILRADLGGLLESESAVRVVGNLPYNISTPILFRLLELADGGRRVRDATVMLQLEVAQRLAARPGSKAWGVLGACQQWRAEVERLFTLPPGAFRPPPRVQSAVVRVKYRVPRVALGDPAAFDVLVREIFLHRRKVLTNTLASLARARGLDAEAAAAAAGIDGRRRPETLDLDELARLSQVFGSA